MMMGWECREETWSWAGHTYFLASWLTWLCCTLLGWTWFPVWFCWRLLWVSIKRAGSPWVLVLCFIHLYSFFVLLFLLFLLLGWTVLLSCEDVIWIVILRFDRLWSVGCSIVNQNAGVVSWTVLRLWRWWCWLLLHDRFFWLVLVVLDWWWWLLGGSRVGRWLFRAC